MPSDLESGAGRYDGNLHAIVVTCGIATAILAGSCWVSSQARIVTCQKSKHVRPFVSDLDNVFRCILVAGILTLLAFSIQSIVNIVWGFTAVDDTACNVQAFYLTWYLSFMSHCSSFMAYIGWQGLQFSRRVHLIPVLAGIFIYSTLISVGLAVWPGIPLRAPSSTFCYPDVTQAPGFVLLFGGCYLPSTAASAWFYRRLYLYIQKSAKFWEDRKKSQTPRGGVPLAMTLSDVASGSALMGIGTPQPSGSISLPPTAAGNHTFRSRGPLMQQIKVSPSSQAGNGGSWATMDSSRMEALHIGVPHPSKWADSKSTAPTPPSLTEIPPNTGNDTLSVSRPPGSPGDGVGAHIAMPAALDLAGTGPTDYGSMLMESEIYTSLNTTRPDPRTKRHKVIQWRAWAVVSIQTAGWAPTFIMCCVAWARGIDLTPPAIDIIVSHMPSIMSSLFAVANVLTCVAYQDYLAMTFSSKVTPKQEGERAPGLTAACVRRAQHPSKPFAPTIAAVHTALPGLVRRNVASTGTASEIFDARILQHHADSTPPADTSVIYDRAHGGKGIVEGSASGSTVQGRIRALSVEGDGGKPPLHPARSVDPSSAATITQSSIVVIPVGTGATVVEDHGYCFDVLPGVVEIDSSTDSMLGLMSSHHGIETTHGMTEIVEHANR